MNESRLLYLKGALNAVKSQSKSGDIHPHQEATSSFFQCKKERRRRVPGPCSLPNSPVFR